MLLQTDFEDLGFTLNRTVEGNVNDNLNYSEYICLSGPFQGFRPVILSYYESNDEIKMKLYKEDYLFIGKVFIKAELELLIEQTQIEPIVTASIKIQGYE